MQKSDFRGVLPTITTKLTTAQEVGLAGAVTKAGLRTRPDLAKYGL
ncbi:MAG: hypothetical protein P4M09_10540 [Devosia sp.]|nr:hypothetical protein [Devosia sp.]